MNRSIAATRHGVFSAPSIVPAEPWRCLVTGTGLTHKASAENRQSMHGDAADDHRLDEDVPHRPRGRAAGRRARSARRPSGFTKAPATSSARTTSRWTCRTMATTAATKRRSPACYLIGPDGTPHRVGLVQGNEFSDHVLEAKNYLYLAQSKLRSCSLGPEIVIGGDLSREVRGDSVGRAARPDDLVRPARQRRAVDVPHAGQPRAPPLQARRAPPRRATRTCTSSARTCSASRTACGSKTAT